MKYLILLFSIIICIGCAVDPEYIYVTEESQVVADEEQEEEDADEEENVNAEIAGAWQKTNRIWLFDVNGDFVSFNFVTETFYNYGYYVIDPGAGTIYLEDYYNMEVAEYEYEIRYDYPEPGDICLIWLPGEFVKRSD